MSVETKTVEQVGKRATNESARGGSTASSYMHLHTYILTYHSFKISGSRNSPDLSPAPLRAAPTPDTDPTATITHTYIDTPIHTYTLGSSQWESGSVDKLWYCMGRSWRWWWWWWEHLRSSRALGEHGPAVFLFSPLRSQLVELSITDLALHIQDARQLIVCAARGEIHSSVTNKKRYT